jgi:nitroreductase/NAD-dependent dihydropyrimidine dehydrogenase PreA subunit
MDALFTVDLNACTRCGLCSRVCSYMILEMGRKGPRQIRDNCNGCGHCVAVCPQGALDNRNTPRASQASAARPPLSEEDAAYFLRSRRSIRWFKNRQVARDTLVKLLDMARYAPTGSNSQGLSYLVIDKGETLRAISAAIADWEEIQIAKNSPLSAMCRAHIDRYRRRRQDSFLYGAPCLVLALSKYEPSRRSRENAIFSLLYAQLFAPSIGLGTCWMGVLELCALDAYEPLLRLLDLPGGQTFSGAMIVGYPRYTHVRMPERDPLQLRWQGD